MPLRSADACETQAGLILLAAVAAQITDDLDAARGAVAGRGRLGQRRWHAADRLMAAYAAWDTKTVLRRLGAFADEGRAYGR